MYREVKKFIEDNINLIDEGRFTDLNLPDDIFIQGEFWEVMRNAGINPLVYLKNIPIAYMKGEDIKEFKCPSNIESIDSNAFSGCDNLRKVVLSGRVYKYNKNKQKFLINYFRKLTQTSGYI